MIETGTLYGSHELLAGVIAGHHPAEYVSTRVAEGAIPFGCGITRGTGGQQVRVPSSADDVFVGVSRRSIDAGDFDNGKYSDKDPVGNVEIGFVMVRVEEAVGPNSPVRIRHAQESGTKGSQKWGFSAAKTGSSPTDLADDATPGTVTGSQNLSTGHDWSGANAKTFAIEVNGGEPNTITCDADCDDLTAVLAALNAKLAAADLDNLIEAVASTNFVKLQTKASGAAETIEIAEGTGALAQLGITAGTYAGNDGTTYTAAVKINGVEQALTIAGYKAQTIAELVAEIDAFLTGATISFIDADDDIKIESDTVGDGSKVEIVDDTLFSALADINEEPDVPIDGSGNPDDTTEPGNFCTNAVAGKTMLLTGVKFDGSTSGPGLVPLKLMGIFSRTADI